MKYIIARYNENVSWADNLDKFIVQKGEHLPQAGREPSSYFWYIINNYDNLSGTYAFRQGNPHDHKVGEFTYVCDWSGKPHHSGLRIKEVADMLGLEIPEKIEFTAGAQFDITAEQIKQRPLEWYKKAYEISMGDFTLISYVLERLWKYIFNL